MSRFGLAGSIVLACGVLTGAASGGVATLASGGHGSVLSISCAAPGECAAGGSYLQGPYSEAFVVSETNGTWGNAIEVPGTATLNSGGHAEVDSISCAAAGECAAGGHYTDRRGERQAFVVSETSGSWGTAIEVPGTATLGSGGRVRSISCGAPGECAAGGSYRHGHKNEAFVVSETNGTWGDAIKVPGTAQLNSGGAAHVDSISCAAAGECAAGGSYRGKRGVEAFVVSETNGSWGDAIEVPGTAALNGGGDADVYSISCAAAGDCAASGYYGDVYSQAFVVNEANGSWGKAIEVPGTAHLNVYGAAVQSVSCAAPGDCTAGGGYTDIGSDLQAFVVSETNGSWGKAIDVPGAATPNTTNAAVDSISCVAAGDCAAGGFYDDGAFVVSETNGSWGDATTVPGTATDPRDIPGLNSVNSISCAAPGECAGGGVYYRGPHQEAFVVSATNGSWGNAIHVRKFPVSCVVPNVAGQAINAAKKKLLTADCGVGKITNVYSTLQKGHVVAQHPKPGRSLSAGTRIALTVSKGKKP